MKVIDGIKCKAKYNISFYDTVYTIKAIVSKIEISCSEKELEIILERICDMSEYDFYIFAGEYEFGDYNTSN